MTKRMNDEELSEALDRTVMEITPAAAPATGTLVTYESDSVIGRKTISLTSFATWARRKVD